MSTKDKNMPEGTKGEQEIGKDSVSYQSELIAATLRRDLDEVKRCIARDPSSIHDTDEAGNNVVHLCVIGGAAKRDRPLMQYFLDNTDIDLLRKNNAGLDPFEVAMSLNDESACDMLEPYSHQQLDRRSLGSTDDGPSGPESGLH